MDETAIKVECVSEDSCDSPLEETKPSLMFEVPEVKPEMPTLAPVKIEIEIDCIPYAEAISDSVFVCDHCNEEFSAKSSLEWHMNIHNPTTSSAIANVVTVKCNSCNFVGKSMKQLTSHVMLHDKNRKFECNICNYRFVSDNKLQLHREAEHAGSELSDFNFKASSANKPHKSAKKKQKLNAQLGDNEPYKCQHCDYISYKIGWFNVHMKRAHPTEKFCLKYKCQLCDYVATRSSSLKTHSRIHSGEKPYRCNQCDYACKSRNGLMAHVKIHMGVKPYACNLCDYRSIKKSEVQRHLVIHTGEKNYECKECGLKFALNVYLLRHSKVHTNKPHKCSLCDFATFYERSLRHHIKTVHMKIRPYECNMCDKTFASRTNLRKHVMIHMGQKPYECDICGFKCVASYYLKSHMQTHTGDKPFECDMCGFKCASKSNLIKHIRIHIGIMRFECEFCDYKSVASGGLKKHVRKHHPTLESNPNT